MGVFNMKIKTINIYICDFCKKELKTQNGCVKHEIKCIFNPKNRYFDYEFEKEAQEKNNARRIHKSNDFML